MKLVTILGLAGIAAAAASTPSLSTSSNNNVPMRVLQEEDGEEGGEGENNNNNANAMDLTGYSLQYSTCLRTKIASDDDAVEGNSYYVNGAYRAQYNLYATFRLCTDDGNGKCTCDASIEYATDMGDFLTSSMANIGAGGGDETNYLECTYGGAENGVDYYLGPQCSEGGGLVIGTYYDEECTVRASFETPSFSYDTFSSIESSCQDCSYGGCDEMYEGSHHCSNGYDIDGNDEEGVCSAAKRATAEIDYSRVKKRNSGAILFAKVFISMLVIGLIGGAMFLAYTYYVRHRGDRTEHMLDSVPAGAALT